MKVLFLAPYIKETRVPSEPPLPMHGLTQCYIEELRKNGHEVCSSSDPNSLDVLGKKFDCVVIVASSDWLCEKIELLKPDFPVLYFFIGFNSDRPISQYIKPFSIFSEDDFLWPFQFLRDFNSAF